MKDKGPIPAARRLSALGGPAPDAAGRGGAGGATPVGAFVPGVARAAFAAHGFPTAAILADWPAIAGADLAAFTAPERLVWPRHTADTQPAGDGTSPRNRHGRRTGATLMLRVDGPRALEVQHEAPQLIERVNAYFGYGAVATLRILQGPVRRGAAAAAPVPGPSAPLPDPQIDQIEDEALRGALARLSARRESPETGQG